MKIDVSMAVQYTGGNQPISENDVCGFTINRDVGNSDTYSGEVNIIQFEITYTSNGIPVHV